MNLDKIIELFNSIKNNPTAIIGIVFASIGTIASGSYYLITKGNEVNSIITSYDETAGQASSALRKVEVLTERVNAQQEAIIKLQERTSEALLNAREAKIVAESTQKEARASANATKVELEVTAQSLKSEMNTLKRATTNRLGN
jgi:ABC-type phosphate transport system auxiliary subunit